ncbi:MAG: hypothetical protein GY782_01130 [Gammaproteobacteria bacterium]|nr:hypothetical protein [Gammaproteobacteria bacterium]
MITVTGGKAGQYAVQLGAVETKAVIDIAADYGLKKSDVVGSLIHKGFEQWKQAIAAKTTKEPQSETDSG